MHFKLKFVFIVAAEIDKLILKFYIHVHMEMLRTQNGQNNF